MGHLRKHYLISSLVTLSLACASARADKWKEKWGEWGQGAQAEPAEVSPVVPGFDKPYEKPIEKPTGWETSPVDRPLKPIVTGERTGPDIPVPVPPPDYQTLGPMGRDKYLTIYARGIMELPDSPEREAAKKYFFDAFGGTKADIARLYTPTPVVEGGPSLPQPAQTPASPTVPPTPVAQPTPAQTVTPPPTSLVVVPPAPTGSQIAPNPSTLVPSPSTSTPAPIPSPTGDLTAGTPPPTTGGIKPVDPKDNRVTVAAPLDVPQGHRGEEAPLDKIDRSFTNFEPFPRRESPLYPDLSGPRSSLTAQPSSPKPSLSPKAEAETQRLVDGIEQLAAKGDAKQIREEMNALREVMNESGNAMSPELKRKISSLVTKYDRPTSPIAFEPASTALNGSVAPPSKEGFTPMRITSEPEKNFDPAAKGALMKAMLGKTELDESGNPTPSAFRAGFLELPIKISYAKTENGGKGAGFFAGIGLLDFGGGRTGTGNIVDMLSGIFNRLLGKARAPAHAGRASGAQPHASARAVPAKDRFKLPGVVSGFYSSAGKGTAHESADADDEVLGLLLAIAFLGTIVAGLGVGAGYLVLKLARRLHSK